ncbi:hypothetical protein ACWKW2_15650 [Bosea thiooxidans]
MLGQWGRSPACIREDAPRSGLVAPKATGPISVSIEVWLPPRGTVVAASCSTISQRAWRKHRPEHLGTPIQERSLRFRIYMKNTVQHQQAKAQRARSRAAFGLLPRGAGVDGVGETVVPVAVSVDRPDPEQHPGAFAMRAALDRARIVLRDRGGRGHDEQRGKRDLKHGAPQHLCLSQLLFALPKSQLDEGTNGAPGLRLNIGR